MPTTPCARPTAGGRGGEGRAVEGRMSSVCVYVGLTMRRERAARRQRGGEGTEFSESPKTSFKDLTRVSKVTKALLSRLRIHFTSTYRFTAPQVAQRFRCIHMSHDRLEAKRIRLPNTSCPH